jgi:hypothetical protein
LASIFEVYDIRENKEYTMDFKEICNKYKDSNINLFNENHISVISIFKKGVKIAVISKVNRKE